MNANIIDVNRTSTDKVFHFRNSLQRFILIEYHCEKVFLNLETRVAYDFCDVEDYGFSFYRDEDDEDFCGVNTFFNDEISYLNA